MNERMHEGGRDGGKSQRCATRLFAQVRPTLIAADQVACEFEHKHRIEFLAQAIRREHDDVSEGAARDLAVIFCTVEGRHP